MWGNALSDVRGNSLSGLDSLVTLPTGAHKCKSGAWLSAREPGAGMGPRQWMRRYFSIWISRALVIRLRTSSYSNGEPDSW